MDEKPLWVQLYWGKDQREGRFVLQNAKLPKVCSSMMTINIIIIIHLSGLQTDWWEF